MNRTTLQQLSQERVRDAGTLLKAGQWSGAYYLAGYAVECALKACIAKLTNMHDFPNKKFAEKSYTHKIEQLVELTGIKIQRDADAKANAALGTNRLIVGKWEEAARYQQWTEPEARRLFAAITDANNGVLPWIVARW